ncbi:MAG: class I SAM-dependent methyltransferase [Huintestinicola sp.]|uniref:class I SAM-dependent methyltransferase n=1 Tax=Huintestinicola sp. TaxID=2981661 RepID=UPI003EFF7DAB
MDIETQFNKIAREYDGNRRKFIPCFDDFYISSTDFIAANTPEPKSVLDLGAGTGLLTSFWYKHFPDARYVLTDIAEEMLDVARKRFSGCENVSFEVSDYTADLPRQDFDAVISALSIHHLTDEDKQKLFLRIYEKLPEGGIFVNYDQFCAEDHTTDTWYNSYWEKGLYTSGLTETDIALWKERRKLDKECSAEQEIKMLRNSGFKSVSCIYSSRKFSVITALK